MRLGIEAPRVLTFDLENRPLTYLGSDFTFSEVTAIGWKLDGKRPEVRLLGTQCAHPAPFFADEQRACGQYHGGSSLSDMMIDFLKAYDAADLVAGHYIRSHDLPIINGALLELGFPPLEPKLSSDTKWDLAKIKGVSKSQENLAATLGVRAPKVDMSQFKWRAANRLTPEGLELTRKRVVGDVRQNRFLRAKLLELGWLGGPKTWRP